MDIRQLNWPFSEEDALLIRELREQLLGNKHIAGAPRAKKLIECLIDEALAGRPAADFNWKTISARVYGKPDEAVSELKNSTSKRLNAYYASEAGRKSGVVMGIEPWEYAPKFVLREPQQLPVIPTPVKELPPSRDDTEPTDGEAEPKKPDRRRVKRRWVMGAGIVLLLIAAGHLAWRLANRTTFHELRSNSELPERLQVSGTIERADPPTDHRYLIVQPLIDDRPQWVQGEIQSRTWSIDTHVGDRNTPAGTRFRVSVISTPTLITGSVAPQQLKYRELAGIDVVRK